MNSDTDKRPKPITDSPYFWIYLFCSFGLAFSFLMQFKLEQRQTEYANEGQALRERLNQTSTSESITAPQESESSYAGDLNGLYLLLILLMAVVWVAFFWQRARSSVLDKQHRELDSDNSTQKTNPPTDPTV